MANTNVAVYVLLADRGAVLCLRDNAQLVFLPPGPHVVPLLLLLTVLDGDNAALITLREHDGAQRFLGAASGTQAGLGVHLVGHAAAFERWQVQRQEGAVVTLRASTAAVVNFLACDANGLVSCKPHATQAARLLVRGNVDAPVWILQPRDAQQTHEAQELRQLLTTARLTITEQANAITALTARIEALEHRTFLAVRPNPSAAIVVVTKRFHNHQQWCFSEIIHVRNNQWINNHGGTDRWIGAVHAAGANMVITMWGHQVPYTLGQVLLRVVNNHQILIQTAHIE